MGMRGQQTGRELRVRIGLYGRTNVGKSELMNRLARQQVSITSSERGTTTDAVRKSLELPGVGACTLIDTAGLDDTSTLGSARMARSLQTLREVDLALILVRGTTWGAIEQELVGQLARLETPYLVVHTQGDLEPLGEETADSIARTLGVRPIAVSALQGWGLDALIGAIGEALRGRRAVRPLLDGLVAAGDLLLLVAPIDAGAPVGRLILPQVQTLRAALDTHAVPIMCRETAIQDTLGLLARPPRLAITDSQVFGVAAEAIPPTIPLTSFSMLLARQKGHFELYLEGVRTIDRLKAGDRVLIVEGCTHHGTCDDIGRVKLPRWLQAHTGAQLTFDYYGGGAPLPDALEGYRLALICGGLSLIHISEPTRRTQ